MPTFKITDSFKTLVVSPLLAATLVAAGGVHSSAFAQTAIDLEVQIAPFDVLDLEKDRDAGANFDTRLQDWSGEDSVKRLEYAAEDGNEVAMWKLGHIYSSRKADKANHLRAFKMFSRVVRSHVDLTPYSEKAPFTANAFVSLGHYYRNGIPDSPVVKSEEKAWGMFLTAATYYGDPKAQYALFEMCDAEAVEFCSNIQAGRWLKKSAVNGNVSGQAQFGYRQFEGEKGVKRNKVEGLKWLTIARQRAHPTRHEWVQELHERAFSVADVKERKKARERAAKWMRDHCGKNINC